MRIGLQRALATGGLTLLASTVSALDFQVNTTQDLPETNPGDGFCQPQGAPLGFCSLRAAVQEANANPGNHVIFLPGGTDQFILSRDDAGIEDQAVTGDLDIRGNITIRSLGEQRPTISGGFIDRVFDILPGATLIIDNVDVGGGRSVRGGAFQVRATQQVLGQLGIQNSSISLNLANEGGAIWNAGTLVMREVEMFNNAISDEEFGPLARGAAISNRGKAQITNSTFRRNGVLPGGGIELVPDAHVIHSEPLTMPDPGLLITNSTFYENTNGIHSDGVPTSLMHVSMNENGPQGVVFLTSPELPDPQYLIRRSVIHGHLEDCNDLPGDSATFLVAENFNASSDTSCGFGSVGGFEHIQNPFLDEAGDFGGVTTTLMPDFDSVLIDPPGAGCLNVLPQDQRGLPRPVDGDDDGEAICDIGALEYDPQIDPNDVFNDGFESP